MKAKNRRLEKTKDMVDFLLQDYDLSCDLTEFEGKDQFLEATSSMVIDRVNKIVYASTSPRTNADLTMQWCLDNHFELVLFETISHKGDSYISYRCLYVCWSKSYWYLFRCHPSKV
jgi:hypothetical protein